MEAYSATVIAAARQAKVQQAQAQLKAEAKKLRGQAACRGSKLRLRVLTGGAPVTRTDFKVGKQFIGRDSKAPFTYFASKKAVKKRSGQLTARVKLRLPGASTTATVKIIRPKCSRPT